MPAMGSTYSVRPSKGKFISIDKSGLVRVEEAMNRVRAQTRHAIDERMKNLSARIVLKFSLAAPKSWRTKEGSEDMRYDGTLADSFDNLRVGLLAWDVRTTEPAKYTFTNEGTRPPTHGSGFIFPRKSKRILIAGPHGAAMVPWVGAPYTNPHPGTKKNPWAQTVLDKSFAPYAMNATDNIGWVGYSTADWFVDTLCNLINLGQSNMQFNDAPGLLEEAME